MMAALVCVCTPSSLARRGSSLYCGGWEWTEGVKDSCAETECEGVTTMVLNLPNHTIKSFFLLHNYSFATVMNCNVYLCTNGLR